MPVDNAAEAISITGTPSLAPPTRVSGNGDSVRVNADAVSLKIRGVPGVPQLSTKDDRVANAPASKKPKPVYTTIARYETGEKAQYEIYGRKSSSGECAETSGVTARQQ